MSPRPSAARAVIGHLATSTALAVVVVITAGCAGTSHATGSPPVRSTKQQPTSAGPHPTAAPRLVQHASWHHLGPGFRLVLQPTGYGRRHIAALRSPQLARLLHAAGRPPLQLTASVRSSLTDQLRCHAAFASSKPVWDLEAWRPDVGYVATVVHRCNPG